ncbi:nuclear cap-binding protein subunit 3 [Trichonephila clavata]|uniref:Nuclear cap-binding protein subunit 3 n=1 Tax=Trichonephila clavata TaxID=2740835 RepID=A0A8X6L947_TRICU|nr:nuclear cap-binding protein subunit 3 [Trichonephila clavata]
MMEPNIMGKLLPNLKITLGVDSDDQIEEGEISDIELESERSTPEREPKKDVDVVRTWMQTLQNPKVYENKDGGFITGLDLSSEVLIKKLEKRAERFGLEKKDGPITQQGIDDLYKSMGIEPENLKSCKLKNIRLDSLHMRGVNDMSTNDIFKYFGDYGPSSVEWINDVSCNVVWLDAATTARALIGTSRPLILKKKGYAKTESAESEMEATGSKTDDIEAVIEMSDSENDDQEKSEADKNEEMDVSVASEDSKSSVSETKKSSSFKEETEVVEVPVPPGYWRLGLPHSKTKAILLRFATKDDKKLPGAEKRSRYYQTYGNPNYGGLKGLISSSRKRKMQAARNRQAIEKLTIDDSKSQKKIDQPGNAGETSMPMRPRQIKMPRMKMYADEEEEKKRRGLTRSKSGFSSIHSRLGTRYSKDDLQQLGHKFSSASEDEDDDNISIHCTVPARYNVWTDIAESMSREDTYKSSSRSILHSKISRDVRGVRYSSDDTRSSRNLESSRNSRSWASSSSRSSQDLREVLSSSQWKERSQRKSSPKEDLRSKLKRLKKQSSTKYRSPLYMDNEM